MASEAFRFLSGKAIQEKPPGKGAEADRRHLSHGKNRELLLRVGEDGARGVQISPIPNPLSSASY